MPASATSAPRRRRAFWLFVAAMAVALLGGGTIVLLARRAVGEHRAEQARIEAENAAAAGRAPARGAP
ncbi:hypothetical protein [Anaeromyxobacter sp. Fw109-5]|uniref:hypothetical protein n=1 Tax=Anaeromyxobacter sp. (strain Fw109-5) TaxID=404589 RepID=UPI00059E6908|nr:hypothetical protein [Anaeromyxobacter sp. Fw109-5]